ncbi:MAG: hypothetical protein ACLGIN_13365, partial [Candidatus Sericytochromatia bacterium]
LCPPSRGDRRARGEGGAPWPLALALLLLFAPPAEAVEFGGWYGRATLDAWHDDNLARQEVPRLSFYPRGNQDLGGNVGLALGSAFLLTPSLELWLTGSARLSRAWIYPEWSGLSTALFADLSHRWTPDLSSYLSAGSSMFWGGSPYHMAEVGIEQRAWPGGWVYGAAGLGMLQSDNPAWAFWMPGLTAGFQQGFPTGTRASLSYGYQERRYEGDRREPQHQVFLLLGQRMSDRVELRARYGYTLATAPEASYRNGFLSFGLAIAL